MGTARTQYPLSTPKADHVPVLLLRIARRVELPPTVVGVVRHEQDGGAVDHSLHGDHRDVMRVVKRPLVRHWPSKSEETARTIALGSPS